MESYSNTNSSNDRNVNQSKISKTADCHEISPLPLQNQQDLPSNPLLLRGDAEGPTFTLFKATDCNQFFLITYDEEDKIISKNQISIQFKNSLEVANPTTNLLINSDGTSQNKDTTNVCLNQSEDLKQQASNDALQMAMQEIDNDTSLLEPVSYEIKLAAMNALIPKELSDGTNYECPICNNTHARLYDLKSHLSRHFGLSLYLCSTCGRQFSNSSNLIRHARIHSGEKPYKCKDCGKRFNQANGLTTHREYLHQSTNKVDHSCPLCERRYKSLQLLKRHCKISHRDENVTLNTGSSSMFKRQFHCPDCGENFDRKNSLQEHRQAQHLAATSSPVPVTAFDNPVHLKDSIQEERRRSNEDIDDMDSIDSLLRTIQEENSLMESGKSDDTAYIASKDTDSVCRVIEEVIYKVNQFICLECGRQFQRYLSYRQHWGVHETSLRKYECQECGISFAWKSTYMKHQTHYHSSSNQPSILRCNETGCDKEYKSLVQLQEHVKRDHRMIRRFECPECNKQFYKSHDLLVHKRTHSQEKPYICGQCGKAFAHLSHVIRHERSHSNIRPHQCKSCLKSFTQATVLRSHKCRKEPP